MTMELLTVKQAADRFNISVSKVRSLIKSGDVPAAKIGVGWRIEASRLEGYINVLMEQKNATSKARAVLKRVPGKAGSFADRLKMLKEGN